MEVGASVAVAVSVGTEDGEGVGLAAGAGDATFACAVTVIATAVLTAESTWLERTVDAGVPQALSRSAITPSAERNRVLFILGHAFLSGSTDN